MSITLKIKGLDAAVKQANKLAKTARVETQAALDTFGFSVEGTAKQLAPANEGRLRNAISAKRGNLSASVVAAVIYAAYMEFGTRKHAAQYVATLPQEWQQFAAQFKGDGTGSFADMIKSLMVWVKQRGLDDDAAYPIALKILQEGVRARPFLYPAVNANLKQLKEDLNNVIN